MWVDFDVRGQAIDAFTRGKVIMDYGLIFYGLIAESNDLKITFLNDGFVSFSLRKTLTDGLERCGLL